MSRTNPPPMTGLPGLTIVIEGRHLDATATFDRLPLKDILLLEQQTRDFGRPMTWTAVRDLVKNLVEVGVAAAAMQHTHPDIDPAELPSVEDHDEFPWFVALMVWGARRMAGDPVTFDEAVSIRLADIELIPHGIPDEGDAADPRRPARPGSGRAGAKRPRDRKPKKASVKASSGG